MKLLVTESQIKRILKETTTPPYLDYLLDKISEHGYDLLSVREKEDLHRMSNGEQVDPPSEDKPEKIQDKSGFEDIGCAGEGDCTDDAFRMFMNQMPEQMTTTIDGKNWVIFVDEDNGPEHVVVTDGSTEFYVVPFWNGEGMKFEMMDGKSFMHHVDKIPEKVEDMHEFMSHFFKYIMPIMIKKIKKLKDV